MQNCKQEMDGIVGTFDSEEHLAIKKMLLKARKHAKTNTLCDMLDGLVRQMENPTYTNPIDDEINVFFTFDQVGDLIAVLACYVTDSAQDKIDLES